MNINTQASIEAAFRAIESIVAARQRLVSDPHARKTDQVAALDSLDAQAHDAVRRATESVRVEGEKIQRAYQRNKKTSYDEQAVTSAWGRIEKLIGAGAEGMDEIVSRFGQAGYGREAAEAIRQNLSTYLTLGMKGARREEIDRRVAEALDRVERGELKLMGYDERSATEAELDRRGTDAAMKSLQRTAATATATGTIPASATLEMGFALEHGKVERR